MLLLHSEIVFKDPNIPSHPSSGPELLVVIRSKSELAKTWLSFRKSVDVNRDKDEAAQACPGAEDAWEDYHGTIQEVVDSFGGQRGLLLDFHGQVGLLHFFPDLSRAKRAL